MLNRLLIPPLIVGFLFLISCDETSPRTASSLPPREDPGYIVPAFTLTERSGKQVTREDLRGKIWLAGFVFTRCTGPCPQVSATMAQLQTKLKDVSAFRLVTFTVDPVRDQPEELKKYAENFRADADRWLFLTGKEETIQKLLDEGFHIHADRVPNAKPGEEYDHSTKLMVVDHAGVVRGVFDGIRSPSSANAEQEFNDNLAAIEALVRKLNHRE